MGFFLWKVYFLNTVETRVLILTRYVKPNETMTIDQFQRSRLTLNLSYWVPSIYTQQKKLRKSQKTMQHKNTKENNYSIFIYMFRYMSSVEKNVYFSLLAPIPLLWHSVKWPRGQSHFSQKYTYKRMKKTCKFSKLEMQFFWMSHEINLIALNITFRRWACLHQ